MGSLYELAFIGLDVHKDIISVAGQPDLDEVEPRA